MKSQQFGGQFYPMFGFEKQTKHHMHCGFFEGDVVTNMTMNMIKTNKARAGSVLNI
jgi:hypothetical protein